MLKSKRKKLRKASKNFWNMLLFEEHLRFVLKEQGFFFSFVVSSPNKLKHPISGKYIRKLPICAPLPRNQQMPQRTIGVLTFFSINYILLLFLLHKNAILKFRNFVCGGKKLVKSFWIISKSTFFLIFEIFTDGINFELFWRNKEYNSEFFPDKFPLVRTFRCNGQCCMNAIGLLFSI